MRKKILLLVLAGMMAVSAAGCSKGAETKGTDANGEGKQTVKESQAAEESQSKEAAKDDGESPEQTTIRFVSWMTGGEDKAFIEKFMEENPDIKVEVEAVDGTNYDKLLKTRLISDDAPDVFLIQPAQYEKFVKEGYLMDVSDRPSKETLAKSKSLEDLYTIDGKQYGFPVCTQGGPDPIFYNKKYFEKLNIKEPETIEELWVAADKIKEDGVEPFVFGDKDAWTFEMFFRSRQFGDYLKNTPEWGLALYNGEKQASELFKKEFELAEKMCQEGYIGKSSLTMTYPQSVTYFVEGKAAMLPQGTWVPGLDEIKNADPEQFELGCFITPVDETDGKIYMTGSSDRSIVISANTKYAEAAGKLYDWFTREENLSEYLTSQSLTNFLPIDYKVDPVLESYVAALSSDKYEIIMSQKATMPAGFMTMMENGLQSILAGSPAETELQKLNTEFEKIKSSVVVSQ